MERRGNEPRVGDLGGLDGNLRAPLCCYATPTLNRFVLPSLDRSGSFPLGLGVGSEDCPSL